IPPGPSPRPRRRSPTTGTSRPSRSEAWAAGPSDAGDPAPGPLAPGGRDAVTGRDILDSTVTVDDAGVTQRLGGGAVNYIAWDDVVEGMVVTTDQGPFVEDVFFALLGRDGSRCVVPQSFPAAEGLTERLFRLPGFDHAAFREAVSCTRHAAFCCWQRGRSDE